MTDQISFPSPSDCAVENPVVFVNTQTILVLYNQANPDAEVTALNAVVVTWFRKTAITNEWLVVSFYGYSALLLSHFTTGFDPVWASTLTPEETAALCAEEATQHSSVKMISSELSQTMNPNISNTQSLAHHQPSVWKG